VPALDLPQLWQWTEYYCPWSYIAAVRLQAVMPAYRDRLHLRIRPFPLEIVGGGPPNRHELEQEWWLAAMQEPLADFAPYRSDDWPATTLPAFIAVASAEQQGAEVAEFDLRVRRAFFAEGRNIGRDDVMRDLARDAGLDMATLARDLADPEVRARVMAEARLGHDRFGVRGTPTMMLADGTVLDFPLAEPQFEDGRIAAVRPLPCYAETCLEATRNVIERALG
jgi:predicted DsbA family dithiol-disulfide isomerase